MKCKQWITKYREILFYLIFGVATTLVNLVLFAAMNSLLGEQQYLVSNVVATVLAILFAYVTNKRYVFRSCTRGLTELLREMGSFFACRAVSFFLDIGIMWVTVDVWGWPGLLMKLISNVVIIVVNYLASKLLIFNKGKGADR